MAGSEVGVVCGTASAPAAPAGLRLQSCARGLIKLFTLRWGVGLGLQGALPQQAQGLRCRVVVGAASFMV